MPEGHTLRRLATELTDRFAGDVVASTSPQGRFTAGAALVDGRVLERAVSRGKHLFVEFDDRHVVHVHLGLYGSFQVHPTGDGGVPAPVGQVRWRVTGARAHADLRGATTCEVLEAGARQTILARLGPDPLQRRDDGRAFVHRVGTSRAPIAGLLMDQAVIAGVGNVYRTEVLFRHRLPPMRPGRDLDPLVVAAVWADLRALLRAGVRAGRIVTTAPAHRSHKRGPASALDAHYVYRRAGLPCRMCGTTITAQTFLGRNLAWCPTCQADVA